MTQTIKDGWVFCQIAGAEYAHYLIKNGTKSLCGHIDFERKKARIFRNRKIKTKCVSCEKSLPIYIKNGNISTTELRYKHEEESLNKLFAKKPEFRFRDNYLIIPDGIKCSESGCPETGGTIIQKNETINSKPHYCLKHNLRVKEVLAT